METSKAGTMYAESERMVHMGALANYGLNPMAFWIMMESYIARIHPLPIKFEYVMTKKDIMDRVAESKSMVTIYIETAGYLGKRKGNIKDLDLIGANLFARSYYEQMRPLPISFQVANAISVHIRTPGAPESVSLNPFRDIYDPTK